MDFLAFYLDISSSKPVVFSFRIPVHCFLPRERENVEGRFLHRNLKIHGQALRLQLALVEARAERGKNSKATGWSKVNRFWSLWDPLAGGIPRLRLSIATSSSRITLRPGAVSVNPQVEEDILSMVPVVATPRMDITTFYASLAMASPPHMKDRPHRGAPSV